MTNPENALAEAIFDLREKVEEIAATPFRIPVLAADPEDGPGNLWLMTDGRLRGRDAEGKIVEWSPVASPGAATSAVALPEVTVPKSYFGEWEASWTQTYSEGRGRRSETEDLFYGDDLGYYRENAALIGLPDLRSDLAGSTIRSVRLYLENMETRALTGTDVLLGAHTNASKPSLLTGMYQDEVDHLPVGNPDREDRRWRQISNWFGEALRDGKIKGLSLMQKASTSEGGYGRARGTNVRLAIDYVK